MPIPFVGGAIALLVTFTVLKWAWLALFTSLVGVMLAAVIAHGVGTAVAMTLDLPTPRALSQLSRRVVFAATCAVIVLVVLPRTFTAIAYLSPRLYGGYPSVAAILSAAIVYLLCALAARRIEPAWNRFAAPLAVVALVVTSITVMSLTTYAPPIVAPAPGGANYPDAAPPRPIR